MREGTLSSIHFDILPHCMLKASNAEPLYKVISANLTAKQEHLKKHNRGMIQLIAETN